MAKIGIICGMVSEVRALGRWADHPEIAVTVSGARPDRAEELAGRLASDGVGLLMSWGIAGGLDPAIQSGDLLIPNRVVLPGGQELPLAAKLVAEPENLRIAGADRVIASVGQKAALANQTQAAAVDMETHRVAVVAERANIPCLAVRAVSDPASRALPGLASDALGEDGRPRLTQVMLGLLRRPGDLPGLVAAGVDSARALRRLTRQADRILSALLA